MASAPAASGYKQQFLEKLSENSLIFAKQMIDANRENDWLSFVCNTTILQALTGVGERIYFKDSPRVGAWRPYEQNQHLIPDQPSSQTHCISICKAAYKSIKLDDLDINQIPNYATYEKQFLQDAYYNLSDLWHSEVITGMQLHVSKRNTGQAGRYRNINLGTLATPLHLDVNSIITFFAKMRQVFQDSRRWYDREMFMLVPPGMRTLLLQTLYQRQMCCSPEDSVLLTGLVAKNIDGFMIIETNRVQSTIDPATKRIVYPIIAGWNEAYGFAGDVIKARVRDLDSSFGSVYDMLAVYGGGVLYPDGLAKAYVTLDTDGIVTP